MHKQDIDQIELRLLKLLSSSTKGLGAYTLFRRVKTTMSSYSHALRSLTEKELIEERSEGVYAVTPKGYQLALTSKSQRKEKNWRSIPKGMTQPKLDPNEMYIPNILLLDNASFQKAKNSLK